MLFHGIPYNARVKIILKPPMFLFIHHILSRSARMTIFKQTVGIDISYKTFDARFGTITVEQQQSISPSKSFKNSPAGFNLLLRWINKLIVAHDVPVIFVMEATGVYYEHLAHFLVQHDYQVAVILPNKIRNYAKSLDSKSKTDSIDAAVITRFALERQLPLWTPPAPSLKTLRDLCREYHALKSNCTQIKNQLHALKASFHPHKESFKRKQQLLKFLNRQIALLTKELRALVKSDPALAQHLKQIKTAKGLGDITILTVLAETRCFQFVTNQKQLTSYAGLDIVFNDSGLKKGRTSISKKGNAFIRKALFMPALSACRANPKLKELYQRLVAKGKNKKLAIIAVARKLLLLIYTLWKTNSPYIPDYKPVAHPVTVGAV
jgi:transposase